LFVAVLAAGLTQGASGDYLPPKWIQLPDVTPEGIDVKAGPIYWEEGVEDAFQIAVADDFRCTQTAPIKDIHIWGSWRGDQLPPVGVPEAPELWFGLAIFADIPACQSATGHSMPDLMPGRALWYEDFGPGEYEVQLVTDDATEGWMRPRFLMANDYEAADHQKMFQYNFYPEEPFLQQGTPEEPIVYWLGMSTWFEDAEGEDNFTAQAAVADDLPLMPEFGWKTSPQGWNDAAVAALLPPDYEPGGEGDMSLPGDYDGTELPEDIQYPLVKKLVYPCDHPLAGEDMDMAFVITPEPASVAFIGLGLIGVLARRRRRR
jgi:hypothetical protein